MHHRAAGGVPGLVAGAVGGVLEGHPAVAGLREGAHHPRVEVTRLHLPHEAALGLRGAVGLVERGSPQVGQLRGGVGVDERPDLVGLHPAHELVGHPVGEVEVVGAPRVLAGVVAQLEELLHVGVPRLEVDAGGALAAAALVDRGDRRVEGAQERHDAVGLPVGAPDQRATRAHPAEGQPDAAGELRQLGHLGVAGVDRVEVVAGAVHEVARGHLGVPGAGVEERRRRRQVGQPRHQPVELDGLAGGAGQAAGHPEQEVLRRLDDEAGRGVPQQVAVVDRAEAEVLEAAIGVPVDREVQLAGVVLDERRGLVADQPLGVAQGHRLAERRDALVAHLLVDEAGQEPGGELAVLRLLADHLGGGLDGQPVELGGRGAVVQATDGAGGDPHGVDLGQVVAAPVDGADDLVDVDGLVVAVPLADLHPGAQVGGDRHSLSSRDGLWMVRAREGVTVERDVRRVGAASYLPSAVPRGIGPPHPTGAARWQVFGLAGAPPGSRRSTPTGRRFPGRSLDPVRVTAVVPTHRCGAVPDSHRVPSCLETSG